MSRMKELYYQEQMRLEAIKDRHQARNHARYKRASEDNDVQLEDLVRLAEYKQSLGDLLGD